MTERERCGRERTADRGVREDDLTHTHISKYPGES